LFLRSDQGEFILLREDHNNAQDRWSEHGLGHLLNPTDIQSDDRDWIAQAWIDMMLRAQSKPTKRSPFHDSPAVSRITISSPSVMRPFVQLNIGKDYCNQIKPFNFLLTVQVNKLGHPVGGDPERFRLIAPYELNPKRWLKNDWIDQYSGDKYRIITTGPHGTRRAARVKTYGEVLNEYEFHPEAKCADAQGKVCGKQTVGLLQRRHIQVARIRYIGKESNSLEEVDAGLVHSEQTVYTEYIDPRRDEWQAEILPAMKRVPLTVLQKESGFCRRMLMKARAGITRPHRKNRERLAAILRQFGLLNGLKDSSDAPL
jgi:hypothetical protein